MQNLFGITDLNGNMKYFNVRIPEEGIKRSFSVADSDKAGRVLTGRMMRDIIGTFYNYTITIDTNNLSKNEYDEFYEIISAPVDYHKIIVPYAQTRLEFDAYITEGEDTLKVSNSTGNTWTGLSLNFIAMEPLRIPTGV